MDDGIWGQLAARYVRADGERLEAERKRLEGDGVRTGAGGSPDTRHLDFLVQRSIRMHRRNRWLGFGGTLAACLCALLVWQAVVRGGLLVSNTSATSEMAQAAPATGITGDAAAESAQPMPEASADGGPVAGSGQAVTSGAPASQVVIGNAADAAASSDTAGAPARGEIIPLAAALPPSYTVKDVKEDRGETIYTLDNTWRDEVVLSLRYESSAGSQTIPADGAAAGLHPIIIKDGEVTVLTDAGAPVGAGAQTDANTGVGVDVKTGEDTQMGMVAQPKADPWTGSRADPDIDAWGVCGDGYQLLQFEKGGISYTMTCKYSFDTLVRLYEALTG
ncbi:MAG: hypothetical protein LBR77_04610 [Lachnospiraceae bacterium]|nr:hypothetical protein [Lachnospiraceae bacterium]